MTNKSIISLIALSFFIISATTQAEERKTYYDNGNLKTIGNHKNGKVEGESKIFYENGKLQAIENHKNDKREGEKKTFYENGNLHAIGNFKNGKVEGKYKTFYINGDLNTVVNFKNGKPIEGYMYDMNGKKTKMTEAHLYNIMQEP